MWASSGCGSLSAKCIAGATSLSICLPSWAWRLTLRKQALGSNPLSLLLINWVLPEDYCKKDPCNFNTEMFVSKVGNPCPTLGQVLASRILHTLLIADSMKLPGQDLVHRVAQLLVNSSPIPLPMGSCKGFLAVVLWQCSRHCYQINSKKALSGRNSSVVR